jgi:hypothetical protein
MVPAACGSVKACRELQSHCATSTDWRFRFGAVALLLDVLQGSGEPGVRSAALRGSQVKGTCGAPTGGIIINRIMIGVHLRAAPSKPQLCGVHHATHTHKHDVPCETQRSC